MLRACPARLTALVCVFWCVSMCVDACVLVHACMVSQVEAAGGSKVRRGLAPRLEVKSPCQLQGVRVEVRGGRLERFRFSSAADAGVPVGVPLLASEKNPFKRWKLKR